jgi:hypothetical protein
MSVPEPLETIDFLGFVLPKRNYYKMFVGLLHHFDCVSPVGFFELIPVTGLAGSRQMESNQGSFSRACLCVDGLESLNESAFHTKGG